MSEVVPPNAQNNERIRNMAHTFEKQAFDRAESKVRFLRFDIYKIRVVKLCNYRHRICK